LKNYDDLTAGTLRWDEVGLFNDGDLKLRFDTVRCQKCAFEVTHNEYTWL